MRFNVVSSICFMKAVGVGASLEDGIPKEAARARILYIKSSLGHMPLVTDGVALPMILRTLRARRLVRQPLAEILQP